VEVADHHASFMCGCHRVGDATLDVQRPSGVGADLGRIRASGEQRVAVDDHGVERRSLHVIPDQEPMARRGHPGAG
jgi:hypothetical protein